MSVFDKGFFTILGLAALLIVVAIPLVMRKVPRNRIYGYRTRATLSSDEIWYPANAHFGRGLIVASLCGAALAVIVYLFQPFSPETFLPVSLVVLVTPSLVATLATMRFIRSLESGDR